jgi:hypothetical protein
LAHVGQVSGLPLEFLHFGIKEWANSPEIFCRKKSWTMLSADV